MKPVPVKSVRRVAIAPSVVAGKTVVGTGTVVAIAGVAIGNLFLYGMKKAGAFAPAFFMPSDGTR